MSETEAIRFECAVAKVQTLADGGLRISFDLSEQEAVVAAKLIACKAHGVILEAELTPKKADERTGTPRRRAAKRRK